MSSSKERFRRRLATLALVLALSALHVAVVPAIPAEAATSTAKGPIGWDTLRHLDQFATMPQGVETRQFSSFDRAGRNRDRNNCLRGIGTSGCVMAETQGAGEIDSIWLTSFVNIGGVNNWGDISQMGNLVVVLDGTTVINSSLQSVVNGSLGAPFVYPLVANSDQSSGGVYVHVPMTYRSSMLVYTTQSPDPHFYHVTYRSFADSAGVTTFDPTDRAADVFAILNAAGTADPKPAQPGAQTVSAGVTVAPGASVQLASISGPASISGFRLSLPQLAPPPSQQDPADDGRAFGSGGSSQFTIAIDPNNSGVRLTRRLDQSVGNQVADVFVDGTKVAQWSALAASSNTWVDQSIDLPATATAGKASITIKNQFVSSAFDFNEFMYWADSLVQGQYIRTDTLDVGPNHTSSESQHAYSIVAQTYAGNHGLGLPHYATGSVPLLTDDGRAFGSGGSSSFTVQIDPLNTGVRLTRRFDGGPANQVANVTVNGAAAGQWTGRPSSPAGQVWVDQTLDLPPALTAGLSSITIKNQFVSAAIDCNEFTYWVDSTVNGRQVRTDTLDVGPNNLGSEAQHAYSITAQTWSGVRTSGYVPAAVLDTNAILSSARIRISFDGSQTVDSPLGEFFGSSQAAGQVRSLMTGMDLGRGTAGGLSAWWPMPFSGSATVSLFNGSAVALTGGSSAVTSAPCSTCASGLSAGTLGYFRATFNAVPAASMVDGKDYAILHTPGHGKFVGVTLGMTGPQAPAFARTYLEGNERVYIDGSSSPVINGTGTEDFFGGGWYFTNGPFTLPFNGNPSHQQASYGCPAGSDCTSAYRLMVTDAIEFNSSINFGIEHGFDYNAPGGGHGNDVAASYSSTAFWYGQTAAADLATDTVTVGDPASESQHSYTASGTLGQVTSTYEGNDGAPTPVTFGGRMTTAPISFSVAIDPSNVGVSLRRTSDQNRGYQQAAVSVDGQAAGTWLQPLANPYRRWLDDTFQIPPALTSGKSRITISLQPAAGAPAWSASRYVALSMVSQFADTQPPSTVTGLLARAASATSVGVTWAPATDNVSVDQYLVYAAQGAAPAIGPDTLAGTTPVPSFAHTGLSSGQNWRYRVIAVDAAGNAGAPSADVAVTVAAPVKIEAESLVSSATGTASVTSQANCCGVVWSGNAQMWVHATAAYQYASITFSVPTSGRYDLGAVQTLAGDYGIATVAVDGAPLGRAINGYAPSVQITDLQDLGPLYLQAGNHTFTVTVPARDPGSAGYFAGYDYLVLSPSSADSNTFTLSANFSATTQGWDNWRYQQTADGVTFTDLTAQPSGTWQGACAYNLIWAPSQIHPDCNDTVVTWVAPRAGPVRITGNPRKQAAGGDGVQVKILQNGAQAWPASGWQFIGGNDTTGVTHNVTRTVAAGDAIRFIVNRNVTLTSDETNWDPTIQYADPSTFTLSTNFSATTQGWDGWRYQQTADGVNFTDLTAQPSGTWQGACAYNLIWAPSQIHPDCNDTVVTWVAPRAGPVTISGNPRKQAAAGDGVQVKILQNATQIWPAGGWQLIGGSDTIGVTHNLTATVAAGDTIRFVVNRNVTITSDETSWNPTIQYTG